MPGGDSLKRCQVAINGLFLAIFGKNGGVEAESLELSTFGVSKLITCRHFNRSVFTAKKHTIFLFFGLSMLLVAFRHLRKEFFLDETALRRALYTSVGTHFKHYFAAEKTPLEALERARYPCCFLLLCFFLYSLK